MGGKQFSNLPVPRMPPDVYQKTRTEVHAVLRQYFHHVDTPKEAPGKKDYGDVDVLVAGPISGLENQEDSSVGRMDGHGGRKSQVESRVDWNDLEGTMNRIYQDLHAVAKFHTRRNPLTSLAIPWPLSAHKLTMSSLDPHNETDEATTSPPVHYAQLDIHLCSTFPLFKWTLFHQSYGDLWNILGSTIRRYGLTANDTGLHLRIEPIELVDRKRSLVFLTHDPDQVLAFLRLDTEAWKKGFATTWEMYEFAASCRMFTIGGDNDDSNSSVDGPATGNAITSERHGVTVHPGDTTLAPSASASASPSPSPSCITASIDAPAPAPTTKQALKHSDRKRLTSRPIFAGWITAFLPHARSQPHKYNHHPPITRATLVTQAFASFGPALESAYTAKLTTFQHERNVDEVWRYAIKAAVPVAGVEPPLRAAAIRGLKAIVLTGEGVESVVGDGVDGVDGDVSVSMWVSSSSATASGGTRRDTDAEGFLTVEGFLDVDRVRAFVARNWEVVGKAVWAQQKRRDGEAMSGKTQRQRQRQKVGVGAAATAAAVLVDEGTGSASGMIGLSERGSSLNSSLLDCALGDA